jgi:TetR/AcrR family transcriptional regulator, ethionamide resistance regulator
VHGDTVHRVPRPTSSSPTERTGVQQTAAEMAILEATERLLRTTALHELSASTIIEVAGISRPTFYSYFPSKFTVVALLLRQVFDEVFESIQPWLTSAEGQRPELVLREILRKAAVLLHQHRAIVRAAHENAHADPEIGAEWYTIMQRFRSALVAEIDAVRAAGAGPSVADVELLSSTLIWSSERVFYLSTRGVDPTLSSPEAAVEGLLSIWVPAIYGTPHTPPPT